MAALSHDPSGTALLTDFDGTLAPIVTDPARARPVAAVPGVLAHLAERLAVVGVVSGRPVSFLADRLRGAGDRVRLFGLYGLEWRQDGEVCHDPRLDPWVDVVADVTTEAAASARTLGAEVEPKGASVTLHWRTAPAAGPWALEFAVAAARRTGLVAQPGRRSVELRPPVAVDKGTVVEGLAAGCRVACFAGDDAGDVAAFAALGRLAAAGVQVQRVAVADSESPPELARMAELVVPDPAAFVALLARVAAALP